MKILAIGAHPDDIEIGAGGTLARHVKEGDEVTMLIVTQGDQGGEGSSVDLIRVEEAKQGALALGVKEYIVLDHKDTKVNLSVDLIREIEEIVKRVDPKRAYIHYYNEIHQDHRAVSYAALSALRNTPQILMYEGPSTFPDFVVNFWVDISKTVHEKEAAILSHQSQGKKEILKLDAIISMNKYRGFQCRKEFAEGFKIFRMFE